MSRGIFGIFSLDQFSDSTDRAKRSFRVSIEMKWENENLNFYDVFVCIGF